MEDNWTACPACDAGIYLGDTQAAGEALVSCPRCGEVFWNEDDTYRRTIEWT